ncbi:MAG TPA: ATP-binding protein [Kofleriaceae bacterium]|nr:ATP-binding protein [Kofleriaceae bacterium]
MTDDRLVYLRGLEQLLQVAQQLSATHDLATILATVARAARELIGADGASIALRDGDRGRHAEEDAIAPLWKGEPFALDTGIAGWVIRRGETVALDDARADERFPACAHDRFVRGLVMAPIRRADPIGALGAYWAAPHRASHDEVRLLDALADAAAVAIANLEQWTRLESRAAERAALLEATNRELEAFSYAVSHDLRAPLRAINGFSQILVEDHAAALGTGRQYLDRIRAATRRMGGLIDDLLRLSQMATSELDHRRFDLAHQARDILDELRAAEPDRRVDVAIPAALPAHGDPRLVRVVLENLLRNAWKFTSKRDAARIELGAAGTAYFVRDNGAGFDPARADKLFTPFHRLHTAADFEGTGVGLATAQRIVHRHGGRIWAESAPERGATFYFTLG